MVPSGFYMNGWAKAAANRVSMTLNTHPGPDKLAAELLFPNTLPPAPSPLGVAACEVGLVVVGVLVSGVEIEVG